jgi:hypothetical protein
VRFSKADGNAKEIDDWMVAHGASVWKLDAVGGGWPDRVYGIRGTNVMVELKNPSGKNKVSKEQMDRALHWRGSPIHVWRTTEDAARTLRECYRLNV